jgi:hypothetical protein
MLLHHPFRQVKDLLLLCDQPFKSWSDAYAYCRASGCEQTHADDFLQALFDEDEDREEFVEQPEQVEADDVESSWAEIARQLPGREGVEVENADDIGNREIDRRFKWRGRVWQVNRPWSARNSENPENLQNLNFEILCPAHKLLSWAQCHHYFRWQSFKIHGLFFEINSLFQQA